MSKLKRRILEEMVYERLLAAVDPGSIIALGRDLDRSIEQAVDPADGPAPNPDDVKLALLRKALERLDEAICEIATVQLPLV